MNPLRGYERHLRILVLIAVAAYSVASQGFELGFILAAAIIVSGYVSTGPRGRFLPRGFAGLTLAGIFLWNVYDFVILPELDRTMISVSRLAIMVATLRLFERRKPREDAQLVYLPFVSGTQPQRVRIYGVVRASAPVQEVTGLEAPKEDLPQKSPALHGPPLRAKIVSTVHGLWLLGERAHALKAAIVPLIDEPDVPCLWRPHSRELHAPCLLECRVFYARVCT